MGGASATQSFFQLAVAAIPALLFGGSILGSRQRGKRDTPLRDGERVFAVALVALVSLAGAAEIVAVRGAVDGSIGGIAIDFVAFVICAGTLALIANIVTPWVAELCPPIANSERRRTRGAAILVGFGGVALVGALLAWVHAGVSDAQYSQNVGAAFTSFIATAQAQSTSYDQTATARETALTFVPEHPWAVAPSQRAGLETQIHQLVDRVDQLQFESHEPPGSVENEIVDVTRTVVRSAQDELGGNSAPAAILVTIVADEVKATAVAYVKAASAKSTALQVLRTACSGGHDPRCSDRILATEAA
jgi:hypothetical protein